MRTMEEEKQRQPHPQTHRQAIKAATLVHVRVGLSLGDDPNATDVSTEDRLSLGRVKSDRDPKHLHHLYLILIPFEFSFFTFVLFLLLLSPFILSFPQSPKCQRSPSSNSSASLPMIEAHLGVFDRELRFQGERDEADGRGVRE
ncbi:hypothetical protein RJT34_13849 [Clitoria ternatea]|uniref:Uncharacterized protein n=1 Tax=Clitoria ternatea TaxID=43366 RepID=A0AAN9JPP1_CLITE